VVVGTPGRLRDHLDRGRLDVTKLRAVVLDEADEMLDLGFREDLEHILGATPAERRTLLCSATLPREIAALAKKHQRDALRIATSSEHEPHGDIEYLAVPTPPHERDHAIVNLLRYFDVRGALVFCRRAGGAPARQPARSGSGAAVGQLCSRSGRALQARDGRARRGDRRWRAGSPARPGLVTDCRTTADPHAPQRPSGRAGLGTCVAGAVQPPGRRAGCRPRGSRWTGRRRRRPTQCGRGQERIVAEVLASSDAPADDDVALAAKLLAERTPEQLAAALVKLHRDRLPAPEDIDVSPPPPPRRVAGPPRRSRVDDAGSGGVWFRVNVGHNRNADPKWLVGVRGFGYRFADDT
jgi:ATP-dependent RNA helicase DeaD